MSLTRDSLLNYLEQLGVEADSLTEDTHLFSDGVLDSFTMVDLIAFIEKEAEVKMKPGDVRLDNLDSVDRILSYADAAKTAADPTT
jgi:acyl carrier protein